MQCEPHATFLKFVSGMPAAAAPHSLSPCRPHHAVCAAPQVRTQTLVKNAIIQVDATPFKQWYAQHYGVELGKKGEDAAAAKPDEAQASGGACVGG